MARVDTSGIHRRGVAMTIAVSAVALAATACSYIAPKSPPTSAATPTLTQAELDVEAANTMVLIVDDLPPGWSATTHARTASDDADTRRLAACVGMTSPARYTADVDGQDFDKGNAHIETNTTVVPTTAAARADLRALTGRKLAPCFLALGKRTLGSALVSATLHRISVARYGDAALAFRLTARVKSGTRVLTVYDDIYFLLKGRAEVTALFGNIGRVFPASLERSLVRKLAAKLKKT